MKILLCLWAVAGVWASAAVPSKEPLRQVLTRYHKAPAVQASLKKTLELSLLADKKTSEGTLYYSKGQFRLEMEGPDKNIVVLDGHSLWVAEQFENSWHVVKSAAPSLQKGNSLLAVLFGDMRILDQMELLSVDKVKGVDVYKLSPKKVKGLEIKELQIGIADGQLKSVMYADELNNQTHYVFTQVDLRAQIPPDKFIYEPPQGAEVTTMSGGGK